jgi:hypothetical protein
MELKKNQIEEIDQTLKKNGIKYWDLRIEMIDHIVSDIEDNAQTNDFEKELTFSLKRIGWLGNFPEINRKGWQNVNRKYRREYHKGFRNFFKKPKNVLIFILCSLLFYVISEAISFKSFKSLSFFLFASPLVFAFVFFIKSLYKKHGRSVNLDYGFMYLIMSFLVLQSFPTLFKGESEDIQKTMWFVLLPIHSLAFYSGYNLYKKAISKVEKMKKELTL